MLLTALAATLLSLTAAQPGKLSVVNDRLTYGHLGPKRDVAKYLPGDAVFLVFEVQNATFDPHGKCSYAMGMEVIDSKGMELMKQKPRDAVAKNYLGGGTLPCAANMQIPLSSSAGTYTLRVTVVDNGSKSTVTVVRKFDVLPKTFGLIQVGTSADREASIPWSPVGIVGDSMFLNFSAVGFQRNPKTKQPNIKVAMRVLDDKGKPVNAAKMSGEAASDVPESLDVIPMQFGITLNRAGNFMLELTATDVLANKTAVVLFPVKVLTP